MVQAVAPVIAARRASALLALGLLAAAMPGAADAQGGPKLKVPPGFAIDVFADKVGSVRFMAIDPAGTLLVSEPSAGRVLALPDKNGRGKADSVQTVVTGLDQPHGLAFHEGALYVAETSRVQRFAYDPATSRSARPAMSAARATSGAPRCCASTRTARASSSSPPASATRWAWPSTRPAACSGPP